MKTCYLRESISGKLKALRFTLGSESDKILSPYKSVIAIQTFNKMLFKFSSTSNKVE